MYEKRRYDSPPTYSPPSAYVQSGYGVPPAGPYDYNIHSPPAGSYYVEDVPQHFHKWNSPPGIIRILEAAILLLCVAIFACVASTLAWEYNYGYGGMGGYYGGMGYYGGGSYYGGMMGYGYGYGMTSPQAANGFMIAMAVVCFITVLAFFVTSVSKSGRSRSRKFYLVVIIVCAILAFVELIASIVYIMGVNPRAQMTGSMYYSQMMTMCNQFYSPMTAGTFTNQYLYHYCMVDPQEAIAIVCGFVNVILLCVICFFASRVRSKIWRYGKPNIYWDKPFADVQEGPNVEEWVKNVEDGISTVAYSEKPVSPVHAVTSANNYTAQQNDFPGSNSFYKHSSSPQPESDGPGRTFSSSTLEVKVSPSKPTVKRGRRRRRNPELDESQYETDYTTAVDSEDEQDQGEWDILYPEINSYVTRQEYKREFDTDLKRYKQMCAEMDDINDQLHQLSRQLDGLSEDSPQYQGVAEEYNRLKDLKRTPDYQMKKLESKQLRNKLFHIKRMVSDYDKMKG
ncbi:occludin-like [Rhinatrema bivittatum]|uniref:occludin-like n=1 Tax=Rhinatrema bivittatum TaxID=194408 RepID=UPI0011273642|nr:occludin-like [Rhinatrema bivittatum]